MKSQFQTLSFLSNYIPKTALDEDFINSFLVHKFQITPKTLRNALNSSLNPLDVLSFIQWFENGLEALKIARHKNKVVLLGNCTLENCEIIASIDSEGSLCTEPFLASSSEIEPSTGDEQESLRGALLLNNLQPDPSTLKLVPRYIPSQGHRVIFYDFALEVQGVGVVREVTAESDVVFFCYFTYPTSTRKKTLGYSLRENPGFNLHSFLYQNIDRENVSTVLGNSTSCFRRLGRELEKAGKVWKDKTLRIEPLSVEVEKGETYYYISDKLKVVTEKERKTPTSHLRYLAGNYFTSHVAAMCALGKLHEILRNYLASDHWPEFEN